MKYNIPIHPSVCLELYAITIINKRLKIANLTISESVSYKEFSLMCVDLILAACKKVERNIDVNDISIDKFKFYINSVLLNIYLDNAEAKDVIGTTVMGAALYEFLNPNYVLIIPTFIDSRYKRARGELL